MSLNESRGPRIKERWPASFDIAGVSRDTVTREALKQQLLGEEMTAPVSNRFAGQEPTYRDMSKPVQVPYQYKEYPKCLYHPTEKTKVSIIARAKAQTHNQLHPDRPELVPELLPVTVTVNNETEEEKWKAKGFVEQAPHPYSEEAGAEPTTLEDEMAAEEQISMCEKCGKPSHMGKCQKARK